MVNLLIDLKCTSFLEKKFDLIYVNEFLKCAMLLNQRD